MSRISALILALAAVAMAGTASAQSTFKARFDINQQASAEENYAAFERTAQRACVVGIKEAISLMDKSRIERECAARLLADAVKATNDTGMSLLHAERTGAPGPALASRD